MNMHFTGKTVFITGAGSGIGYQTALAFAEQGVHPRVVADDIVSGVRDGAGTILSGKGVGKVAFMKRLLPRKTFRKLLVKASRAMGYLPKQ